MRVPSKAVLWAAFLGVCVLWAVALNCAVALTWHLALAL